MKSNALRKSEPNEIASGLETGAPGDLFAMKNPTLKPAGHANRSGRFRGDLLMYFVALFIWALGSVWFIVKIVNRIF